MRGSTSVLAVLRLLISLNSAAADVPAGYRWVARQTDVPPAILYAVALTESGARLTSGQQQPWPWTLNVAGRGYRFLTRLAAWQALRATLARGVTRVDIGLMQVSWAYHAKSLDGPWRALDPYHNLAVGAGILRTEHQGAADWWQAVGRYHSPNNLERARHYRLRVATWYRRITQAGR